jgi:hypothetical protein
VSLLDGLAGLAGAGIGEILDGAEALAEEHLTGAENRLARGGLAVVRQHEGALAGLSAGAALAVLGRLSIGQASEARLVYLASGRASVAELLAESRAATAGAVAATAAREARFAALMEMAEDLGGVLLKILPLLLLAA